MKYKIKQGGPRVSSVHCEIRDRRLALVVIDMNSKRNEIAAWLDEKDIPSIHLSVGSETLRPNQKLKYKSTVVSFPDFKGWRIFMADSARYSINIVLKKIKNKEY